MKSPNNAQVAKMVLAFSNGLGSSEDLDRLLDIGAVGSLMGADPQHIDMDMLQLALGYPKMFPVVGVDYDLGKTAAIENAGLSMEYKVWGKNDLLPWRKDKSKKGKKKVAFGILNPSYEIGFDINGSNYGYGAAIKRHGLRGANWQEVLAFAKHFPKEQLTQRIVGCGGNSILAKDQGDGSFPFSLMLTEKEGNRVATPVQWNSLTHSREGYRFLCVKQQ